MRKRVKKQLEKARKAEREQYSNMYERSHRLDLETAQLRKALRISEEENTRLKAMFEQLQAEYEELQVTSAHDIQAVEANSEAIAERNNELAETIYELKRPWWRRLLDWLKSGTTRESYQSIWD